MSMPNIPDINPNININRDDAINIIMASIAMEELAIAHILNAEGEKLQYVLGTLDGRDPGEVTICDIMEVNESIHKTLRNVIKEEMLLQLKLEDVIDLADNDEECQLTIRGQKIWRDSNNLIAIRPDSVEITLLRDGEVFKTTSVSSSGNGSFSFPCLPVWKDSENKYTYTVDEAVTPARYIKTIDGFNVINTIEAGSITIPGSKIWDDNNNADNTRPTDPIVVNLYQNGNPDPFRTASVPIPADEEDTVEFTFDNVPQFDNEGALFVYTVDEATIPSGYTKIVNGFDITNEYEV